MQYAALMRGAFAVYEFFSCRQRHETYRLHERKPLVLYPMVEKGRQRLP